MSKSRFIFIILALCAFPLPSLAAESVSKMNTYTVVQPMQGQVSCTKANSYIVTGASPGKSLVSKSSTYVVTGASPTKSLVSKFNAFAITGVAPSKLQVSKMNVYVVVGPQAATNQPNVFITAMREPPESISAMQCDSTSLVESLIGAGP
jgi:hypothetical protein